MARQRAGEQVAASEVKRLEALVDTLIKENRRLKRAAARVTSTSSVDLRPVAGMVRRVERALGDGSSPSVRGIRRRAAAPQRRRPASTETQEKRRQALAKAREVRAAKIRQAKLIQAEESGASAPD